MTLTDEPHPDERNRDALLSLLAKMCTAAGIWGWVTGTDEAGTMQRYIRQNVLRMLLPIESAVRRIIISTAIEVKLPPLLVRTFKGIARKKTGGEATDRLPAFPLFDRRKNFFGRTYPRRTDQRSQPSIRPLFHTFPWEARLVIKPLPLPPPRLPDDQVDAAKLCRRIQVIRAALEDIPKNAKRLARLIERRRAKPSDGMRKGPVRPGAPPGYKRRGGGAVNEILRDCQERAYANRDARNILDPPDTS